MTNELTQKNDEQRVVSEPESNVKSEVVTREFGASIDDGVAKGIDVDANYGNRMFMFSGGRRRRASVIV